MTDGRICLYVRYTTFLSSICRHIWRYCISKILLRYILSSVCLRLTQFSQLSFMQYMRLCVFSLTIPLMMILRIRALYFIIIITSEMWSSCRCLDVDHETMVCAVCLSIFLLIGPLWVIRNQPLITGIVCYDLRAMPSDRVSMSNFATTNNDLRCL